MRPLRITPLLVLIVTLAAYAPAAQAARPGQAAPAGRTPPTQLVVWSQPGETEASAHGLTPGELAERISAAAGTPATFLRAQGATQVFRLGRRLDRQNLPGLLKKIAALDGVARVEEDLLVQPGSGPNDPYFEQQWALQTTSQGIDIQAAWKVTRGAPGIIVAILDTGITPHPDLDGQVTGGYDFIIYPPMGGDGDGRDADPTDTGDYVQDGECGPGTGQHAATWHGTHIAGILGAAGDNGQGIAGVAWQSPLLIVRALGHCGGFLTDIADGLRWAAGLPVTGVPSNPHPARVINLSLGGVGSCPVYFQSAIEAATAAGAVVVAAAGNSNIDVANFTPANCRGVIAVGATNLSGSRSFYSDYGPGIALSAPGDSILSTWNTGVYGLGVPGYIPMTGTSMAAPHAAGVAALVLSVRPELGPADVAAILIGSARPFPAGSSCSPGLCGAGILDAGEAVRLAVDYRPGSASGGPGKTPLPGTVSYLPLISIP